MSREKETFLKKSMQRADLETLKVTPRIKNRFEDAQRVVRDQVGKKPTAAELIDLLLELFERQNAGTTSTTPPAASRTAPAHLDKWHAMLSVILKSGNRTARQIVESCLTIYYREIGKDPDKDFMGDNDKSLQEHHEQ